MSIGSPGRAKLRPDMNVTPLVDVVLVLLIIFMVLAPVLTASFGVRLPPRDDTDQALDEATDDKPVVLAIAVDGACEVNGVTIEREELADRLHRIFNARPDNVLYLDGADEAPYGSVLSGVDLARKGGASPVVVLTKKLQ